MPTFVYDKQKLIKFKDKTAGKNRNPVDGFYETEGEPKKRYFIKKPADQRELFIEGLIGRFFTELKNRKLIDEKYHRSLICADFIQCEDGSYALIQPCEEFDELFKLIGTGYKDGSDRNPLYEMLYGPSLYPTLTKQGVYFGLSLVLMLDILVSNFSGAHSGNIGVFKKSGYTTNEGADIKQFCGIDNGAANRDFAKPENNEDILTPLEYKKGHAWFTKGYLANYRNIKGLFPRIATHARELSETVGGDFTTVITKVFKELPPDLLQNNQKVLDELADYMGIPGFKTATFGPEGNCQSVIDQYAETLNLRLNKLGQLQEAPHLVQSSASVYESIIIPSTSNPTTSGQGTLEEQTEEVLPLETALDMKTPVSFPDRLDAWGKLFAETKTPIDFNRIDYDLLVKDYNHYLSVLARQSDLYNIWQHNPKSSSNLLAPSKEAFDKKADTGYAYVPQYREGAVLRHLYAFAAPGRHAADRFAYYDKLDENYCREEREYCKTHEGAQPSAWLKVVTALQNAQDIMTLIKSLQRTKNAEKEFASDIKMWKENLKHQLQEFKKASDAINKLFETNTAIDASVTTLEEENEELSQRYKGLFFYPLTAKELEEMSGDQLLTICLEELYSAELQDIELSPLVARIISDDLFWHKTEGAYSDSTFGNRTDSPKEKMLALKTLRNNVLQCREILLQFHQTISLSEKEDLLHSVEERIDTLPLYLQAELKNEFALASTLLSQWKASNEFYLAQERVYHTVSGSRKIDAFRNLHDAFEKLPSDLKGIYQTKHDDYHKEVLYLQSFEAFKQVQALADKIAQFEPLKSLFEQLPTSIKGSYQAVFDQLQQNQDLYQAVSLNQRVTPNYSVEQVEKVFRRIQSNPVMSKKLMAEAISDQALWNAIETTNKTVLTREVAQDLLTIKQFHDRKTAEDPNDQQYIREVNQFYTKALGIRLSDKSLKEQATEIIKTAENEFTHRDKKKRFVADVLVLVSILCFGLGLFILGARAAAGKHPLFSYDVTARQQELAQKWMPNSDQLTEKTSETALFMEPPPILVN
ncbi:LepB GTPase-activating domain-containing protein [Legionella maceachernii]|uniref:Effector protein B, substrate of the Dot/Icm secretion system n=1 Tax=Legionella maceachernii TaxID=466 RepID=A0A0W0VX45_9GAMM|nr:LepB GTPase-activating domain-containing protein [Legionella maceachernii]KTD24625.1 effector protein B, substrate of the Dot/Icm secretion system [Legionella maceachernii]SKA25125.1 hypothetical protein SAMN02745128_02809 [Legionella maceachernii]SUO99357.1 Uncharacterised protein [Legionella maceachernii]